MPARGDVSTSEDLAFSRDRFLQAFRHLHVLASEGRSIAAHETSTQTDVKIGIAWKTKQEGAAGLDCMTPCLTPPAGDVRLLS